MILKAIAGFVASVLGGLLDKLASYMAGKQEARQEAKIDTLRATVDAKDKREEIENEIAADPDLVARATRAGLVRGSKPRAKP